ncbi:MAG: hypothetical protein ACT4PT_12545 [Methanobacteriota archaeon]
MGLYAALAALLVVAAPASAFGFSDWSVPDGDWLSDDDGCCEREYERSSVDYDSNTWAKTSYHEEETQSGCCESEHSEKSFSKEFARRDRFHYENESSRESGCCQQPCCPAPPPPPPQNETRNETKCPCPPPPPPPPPKNETRCPCPPTPPPPPPRNETPCCPAPPVHDRCCPDVCCEWFDKHREVDFEFGKDFRKKFDFQKEKFEQHCGYSWAFEKTKVASLIEGHFRVKGHVEEDESRRGCCDDADDVPGLGRGPDDLGAGDLGGLEDVNGLLP